MITKFHPIALQKVWGGSKLSKQYNLNDKKIGEIWGISAHKTHSNILLNGAYKGMTLRQLYKSHNELFGGLQKNEFPLLFKVIDAKDDLSIQVHPSDDYARCHENSYGKDECWYILDTSKTTTNIIIGHRAKSKSEFLSYINNNKVEEIVNKYTIKPGDYFYIPAGTVHAICKGTTLLEVSQSSNITYRVYDYNRLDQGHPRELHIKKSLDVLTVPDNINKTKHDSKLFTFDIKRNKFISSVTSHIFGDYIFVIEGQGIIGEINIKKGDFLMVSSRKKYILQENFTYALINISH